MGVGQYPYKPRNSFASFLLIFFALRGLGDLGVFSLCVVLGFLKVNPDRWLRTLCVPGRLL